MKLIFTMSTNTNGHAGSNYLHWVPVLILIQHKSVKFYNVNKHV